MTANDTIIEVTATKAMANYVWVKLKNETSYNFEDNYFDLAAGQTKQIKNT